jgi:hypothetical protein
MIVLGLEQLMRLAKASLRVMKQGIAKVRKSAMKTASLKPGQTPKAKVCLTVPV